MTPHPHPHPHPRRPALTRRPTRPRSHAACLSGPPPLHASHHRARPITQPGVTTATLVTVSPPGRPTITTRSPEPDPRRCFTRHAAPSSHPGQTTSAGLPAPLSPPFSRPRKWPKTDPSPRPSKTGQNSPSKPTAKICDTPHVQFSFDSLAIHPSTGPHFCRLHKFVTPLRYEIPPFSLAQPRAKICDTPQLRNTPIFPGTALGPNESLFPSPK